MTSRERVEDIRRAIESAPCDHGEWMCAYCENDLIQRAIDAAVVEEQMRCERLIEYRITTQKVNAEETKDASCRDVYKHSAQTLEYLLMDVRARGAK
jgi:hypothetical protein